MSGVDLTSVSEMTPTLPRDAPTMCTYTRIGSAPTSARITPEIRSATTSAPAVSAGDSQRLVASRGSRLIVHGDETRGPRGVTLLTRPTRRRPTAGTARASCRHRS